MVFSGQERSKGKVMLELFFDSSGIFHLELIPNGASSSSSCGLQLIASAGSAIWSQLSPCRLITLFFSLVSAFSQKNKTYKMGIGVCVCVCKILVLLPNNFQISDPIDTKFWFSNAINPVS